MKTMRIAALCLTAAMAFSAFTGCASSGPQSPSNNGGASAASANTGAENGGGSDSLLSEGEIVLTMMVSGTLYENDFEAEQLPILAKEAFPQITMEVTKLPDDQYYTALKTKLAAGEASDLLGIQPRYAGVNSVIGLAEAGYLEPIGDLEIMALTSPSGREDFSYNGQVYAIPSSITMLGTYYNVDMFEANGLSVPNNWEEFLNACQVLQDAGIQPIAMGDKDMYVMQFGLYQIAANKVYPNNPEFDNQLRTGETAFTDEGTWDTVLEMYYTLYDKGYIESTSLGLGAQQAIQKFVDGEAAMTFDGSFNAAALRAEGAASFERGYFPLPANDAGEEIYAATSIGGSPAVYSGSKNKEAAKALLNTWFDGESDMWKAWFNTGKYNPTYGWGSDNLDPLYSAFLDLYNEGKSFYWCNQGWPAGVENEMEALFSEMVGGQGTAVEDITRGMQLKFEELIG